MNEADLRARWLQLIRVELPEAAAERPGWPIRLDHCFARVILDTVCRRPWREVVPAPAWRRMPVPMLTEAVTLAEAILSDAVDLSALNARSLAMRGKGGR